MAIDLTPIIYVEFLEFDKQPKIIIDTYFLTAVTQIHL